MWYVAHTKARQEQIAVENLARQGYGVYLPQLKVLTHSRCRQPIGFISLFPRYVFFQPSSIEHSIAPVRYTKGVAAIVSFGGVPAVLQPDGLQRIRAFERSQNAGDIAKLSGLHPGKSIVVTSGPFAGLEGLVSTVAEQRVTVLMHLLGVQTRVKLSPRHLCLVT